MQQGRIAFPFIDFLIIYAIYVLFLVLFEGFPLAGNLLYWRSLLFQDVFRISSKVALLLHIGNEIFIIE
jgi:hypothetical protein